MKEFERAEPNKNNQTKIGIINMPVFVMPDSLPADKPALKESETSSPFLGLIEIILEIIAATAEAIAGHEKK
jgi:hypothetical protein